MAAKLNIVSNTHKKFAYYEYFLLKSHVTQEAHGVIVRLCYQ